LFSWVSSDWSITIVWSEYGAGFSKTAQIESWANIVEWSHGRQLDTVWRHDRTVAEPVMGRRLADNVAEGPAERAQAGEANVEANVGDASVGLAQQEHRSLDPAPLQIVMRRFAKDGAETTAEMSRRNVRDGGHGRHIERFGVGPIHGVAGPQQSPVEILRIATHR
jgi:hypothetical protein